MSDWLAWLRVQEIERRLREAEAGADVERRAVDGLRGELRMLRQFSPSDAGGGAPAPDYALADPVTRRLYMDQTTSGAANFTDWPIKDVLVTTRFFDGTVADQQYTDIDGEVSIAIPAEAGGTIEYECPRYLTIGPRSIGDEVDTDYAMLPEAGYTPLNAANATLWSIDWEAWKESVTLTDSIRGSATVGASTAQADIGTFNGSPVEYLVRRASGVPSVRLRWFGASSYITFDFLFNGAGDVVTSKPDLSTSARSARYTLQRTRTLTFFGPNPWAASGASFSLTLTVQESP